MQYPHPRVRHIVDFAADARHGLASRFLACLRARFPHVVLQDDDVLLSEAALRALVEARARAPRAPLVGFFGRGWGGAQQPGYVMAEVPPGRAPIALTVGVLASRPLCAAFFDHAPLVEGFVRGHSTPYWNGEDIFMSLVGWREAGEQPLIIRPPKNGCDARCLACAACRRPRAASAPAPATAATPPAPPPPRFLRAGTRSCTAP